MSPQTQAHERTLARAKWIFFLFALIGGFFLVAEHRAHLLPYLPWLFLAAYPLMHIFMHRGRGHHGASHGPKPDLTTERSP